MFAADGSSPGQGIDSNSGESTEISGVGSGDGTPFHEVLARRLELLQSQGALGGIAQLPGGKPLPPFERWVFAARHYEEVRGWRQGGKCARVAVRFACCACCGFTLRRDS